MQKRQGTPAKRRKNDVIVYHNGPGGPRIIAREEEMDLTEKTLDGKPHRITTMLESKAKALGYRYRPAAKVFPKGSDLNEVMEGIQNFGKKPEKKTTLADRALENPAKTFQVLEEADGRNLLGHLRASQKFVMDEKAVYRLGAAIQAYPELLVTNGDFAIAPFPETWVEFNLSDFMKSVEQPVNEEWNGDEHIGYLFVGDEVYIFASDKTRKNAGVMPYAYELHRPMSPQRQELVVTTLSMSSRSDIDMMFWGNTYTNMKENTRVGLRAQHGIRFLRKELLGAGAITWKDFAGDLRLIVGLLLMLNQPQGVLDYTQVDARRRMTHKGSRPLVAHRVVSINLAQKSRRALITPPHDDERVRRNIRWHTVRGHFVHDRVSRESGCDHGGGEWWVEYKPRRFECLHCTGKRSWREYPKGRGDRSVAVEHSYVIKG